MKMKLCIIALFALSIHAMDNSNSNNNQSIDSDMNIFPHEVTGKIYAISALIQCHEAVNMQQLHSTIRHLAGAIYYLGKNNKHVKKIARTYQEKEIQYALNNAGIKIDFKLEIGLDEYGYAFGTDRRRNTLLSQAIGAACPKLVKTLIKYEANPNEKGTSMSTPLCNAITQYLRTENAQEKQKLHSIIQILAPISDFNIKSLDCGIVGSYYPLHHALFYNSLPLELLQLILDYTPDSQLKRFFDALDDHKLSYYAYFLRVPFIGDDSKRDAFIKLLQERKINFEARSYSESFLEIRCPII